MQLDHIRVVVRPRNPWESIDLGFSMVRLWWKPLYQLWFALVLPIFLALYLFFYWVLDLLWLAALLMWWLKPLFDRIILHFLSRALFGEQPNFWQTFQAGPSWLKTNLLWSLTLGRFDFARSFNLPVWQLEGLQGWTAFRRLKVLQKNTRHTAVWLTIVCVHLVIILYFSLFGLLYLMMPTLHTFDFFYILFYDSSLWVEILRVLFNLLAVSVVEPLYVAAGFALYLNRRTHLEGWDIELAFRRIAAHLSVKDKEFTLKKNTLRTTNSVLLILCLTAISFPTPVPAESNNSIAPEVAKHHITEILKQPEFQTTREEYYWKYIGEPSSPEATPKSTPLSFEPFNFIQFLAEFLELLVWLLLGSGIILLLFYGIPWLRQWQRSSLSTQPAYTAKPRLLGEKNLTVAGLPTNIPQQAWILWQAGETVTAMSLLYRGALSVLRTRDGLAIHDSATEKECLRLVKQQKNIKLLTYFSQLTQVWQNLAYAQRLPNQEEAQRLCQEWQHYFG